MGSLYPGKKSVGGSLGFFFSFPEVMPVMPQDTYRGTGAGKRLPQSQDCLTFRRRKSLLIKCANVSSIGNNVIFLNSYRFDPDPNIVF